jgi:hypothetical protein
MNWPTEQETLDEIRTRLGSAVSHAAALAILPAKGPSYVKLRGELKLIEQSARMIAYNRQDARWLQIGIRMSEVHRLTGHLIRRHFPNPYFREIENWLRQLFECANNLQHNATGRVGMILPKPKPGPTRTQDRQIQVLLPDHMRSQPKPKLILAS